jgi:succinylglutamate desuccinylase
MSVASLQVSEIFTAEPVRERSSFAEGDHLIGAFVGCPSGPTLIAVGSLHGNEPAGSLALSKVAQRLRSLEHKLLGRVYLIAGNTRAIAERVRFIKSDLNRQWTPKNLSRLGSERLCLTPEGTELTELDQLLDSILITAMDEVFVLDLHSTSADGMPFATVGDTLRNRRFALQFPVTILLGIEEQLEGTLLEYLNTAGAVTLGFEGGQHFSQHTIRNHEALVWLGLANSGILDPVEIPDLEQLRKRLADAAGGARVFEVRYRHAITARDEFEMSPDFNNFDKITAGQVLGTDRNGPVAALETGIILMPLYQKLGDDGFYIGREISPFWLKVSEILRRMGVQNYVHWLPGVRRHERDPSKLIINTHVARIFPLQVFHLLGFRRRRWVGSRLVVSRRKHDTDAPFRWKGE